MIDRKVLWLSIIVILVMVAATAWRIGLAPDWHRVPMDGPGGSHTVNGLLLFIQPFGVTFATVSLYGRKWFAAGTEDAVRSWRGWSNMFLIAFSLLVGLMQAFLLARSLGYGLALDRPTIARIGFAAIGILMMAAGNAMPKLPWLSMRFRWFQLDAWQQNRQLRFQGKVMVAMGLLFVFFAIALPYLPPKMVLPLLLGVWLTLMAAMLWYRAKLKREPSPTP